MIAYEELERALARWKARRSGAVEAESSGEGDVTPPGTFPLGAGPGARAPQARDQTRELDLVDAEVDDT
jgi:hypothetical protein